MCNDKWKKAVAIIAIAGVLSSVLGTSGYAREEQQNVTEEENITSAEAVENSPEENNEVTSSENELNSSTTNDQKTEPNDTEEVYGEETGEEGVDDMLTPSEAEKNDMANSWRFKDGERIIQESPVTNARSARAITPWTNINGKFYNSRGEVIEGVVAKGIDVSQWNGDINWATVKNTDVDYAIIRCGYGMNQTNQDDPKWKRNADACTQYNIPFGTYLYSYADTVEKAKSEAQHVLRLVKGYNLTYPIYYDLEETSVRNSVSKSQIAQIAKAFCDTIEAAGYRVSIYANTDWFTNYLTDPMFNNWNKWVAQYNYRCTYAGSYTMWQCTSSGSVNGISGAVDLNMDFGTVDGKRLVVKDGKTYCYSYPDNTQLFGEQQFGENWYFFDEARGGAMHVGWYDFPNKRVYYRGNGTMVHGEQSIDGKWYYFDTVGGAMQTGFHSFPNKIVYYGEDGAMRYGEQLIDGKWYYFDTVRGAMQTGFHSFPNKIVYYGEDGAMRYGEQLIDGKWYYFDTVRGTMQTGLYRFSDKTVYYGEDGAMRYGEQLVDGNWYYFDTVRGAMQTGFHSFPNKTVYYGEDGTMKYNEQKVGEDWYYFAPGSGAMQTGIVGMPDGEYMYYGKDGKKGYGEQSVNGKWYYFDKSENGAMVTDEFYNLGSKTVYYGEDGTMRYGEQLIDGNWYYFDTVRGAMQTGFHSFPNKTVYYGEDGTMKYNEQKVGEDWYYFAPGSGAMQTGIVGMPDGEYMYYGKDGKKGYGEQSVNGKWYYFDKSENGAMITDEFYNLGSKTVYYGEDGAMRYGEQNIDGNWYYFDTVRGTMQTGFYSFPNKTVYYNKTGKMLYGEQKIDGKWYAFNTTTGAMIKNSYYNGYYYGSDGVRD